MSSQNFKVALIILATGMDRREMGGMFTRLGLGLQTRAKVNADGYLCTRDDRVASALTEAGFEAETFTSYAPDYFMFDVGYYTRRIAA